MEQKNDTDFLAEWAVWGHLDSKTDLELILLKGHLLLETILEIALTRSGITDTENLSFYRKINTLEAVIKNDISRRDIVILALKDINRLRNLLAHDFYFKISNGEFELWAANILSNLKGEKFTKYTFRTKIVHSFSVLARNVLDLKN